MENDPHKLSADESPEKATAGLLLSIGDAMPPLSTKPDRRRWGKRLRALTGLLKHPFMLLVAGTIVSLVFVPMISSWLDESRLRNEIRQKKVLEFGDRNTEFNNKTNVLRTMLLVFGERPFRLKNQSAQLKTERSAFKKSYAERYDALDEMAWWWYGNIEREANVLRLAPPAQLSQLHEEIRAYNQSVKATVQALDKVRVYLSLDNPGHDELSHEQYTSKKIRMTWEIVKQREIRRELAGRIGVILAATERPYLGRLEINSDENNTPGKPEYHLVVTNFGEAAAQIVSIKVESFLCTNPMPVIVSNYPSSAGSKDILRVESSVSAPPQYDIYPAVTKLGADFSIRVEIYYRQRWGELYLFSSTATYDMESKSFVVVDGQSN